LAPTWSMAYSGDLDKGRGPVPDRLRAHLSAIVAAMLLLTWAIEAPAAMLVRQEIDPGVYAAIKSGRILFLECSLVRGDALEPFLAKYLREPENWKTYQGRAAVAIPYASLNPETQRRVLEAIFPEDYVDERGWWHTVRFQGEQGMETWWALAEWFTGIGTHYRAIMAHPENAAFSENLAAGSRVLIPADFLPEVFRAPAMLLPLTVTGDEAADQDVAEPPFVSPEKDLSYGSDEEGSFAIYRLKRGEAIYSAVVARFTDYREHADIEAACRVVEKRSGITDARRMKAGDRVLIPLEMLSDRYHPLGSERRNAYEAVSEEARRLDTQRMHSRDLDGVTVILDPGHGGRDYGAAATRLGLYEDEIDYDLVCRIKHLLETTTRARVFVTVKDQSQGYTPTDAKRFEHDRDEVILTTPPYENHDAKVSANLRWCLANKIYRDELARGVNERKAVFISVHCDALANGSMRGVMVYVPGAQYRRDGEDLTGGLYRRYAEARGVKAMSASIAERRRDEALSRNLATTLLEAMRTNTPPIKVQTTVDPIRNVIRQSGGRAYLPAVLRNTVIPTKILVEAANLTNATDCKRVADPQWRQWFAEALVAALCEHFNS